MLFVYLPCKKRELRWRKHHPDRTQVHTNGTPTYLALHTNTTAVTTAHIPCAMAIHTLVPDGLQVCMPCHAMLCCCAKAMRHNPCCSRQPIPKPRTCYTSPACCIVCMLAPLDSTCPHCRQCNQNGTQYCAKPRLPKGSTRSNKASWTLCCCCCWWWLCAASCHSRICCCLCSCQSFRNLL